MLRIHLFSVFTIKTPRALAGPLNREDTNDIYYYVLLLWFTMLTTDIAGHIVKSLLTHRLTTPDFNVRVLANRS